MFYDDEDDDNDDGDGDGDDDDGDYDDDDDDNDDDGDDDDEKESSKKVQNEKLISCFLKVALKLGLVLCWIQLWGCFRPVEAKLPINAALE